MLTEQLLASLNHEYDIQNETYTKHQYSPVVGDWTAQSSAVHCQMSAGLGQWFFEWFIFLSRQCPLLPLRVFKTDSRLTSKPCENYFLLQLTRINSWVVQKVVGSANSLNLASDWNKYGDVTSPNYVFMQVYLAISAVYSLYVPIYRRKEVSDTWLQVQTKQLRFWLPSGWLLS